MRFFPIDYYETYDRRGSFIVVFAYDEKMNHISIRFRYPIWFYVELGNYTYDQMSNICSLQRGISLETRDEVYGHENFRDKKNPCIQTLRSTRDTHNTFRVVRVNADGFWSRKEAIDFFMAKEIPIHEEEQIISSTAKLLSERDLRSYCWMEAHVGHPADTITIYEDHEYAGIYSTLKRCEDNIPPPKFSVLSFDGEMRSENYSQMPQPIMSMKNTISALSFIFRDYNKDIYVEKCLVLYGDIQRFDKNIELIKCDDELELIMKFFDLIKEYDPDVMMGHNIFGFDIPYILSRYRLLATRMMTQNNNVSMAIPNFSRLKDFKPTEKAASWNNQQVAISGSVIEVPGRNWIDTLVIAKREMVGKFPDNKLGTLARILLQMGKNDMDMKIMHEILDYSEKWKILHEHPDEVPYTIDELSERIDKLYVRTLETYNIVLPLMVENPGITDVNKLITLCNFMNQKGKKDKILTLQQINKNANDQSITDKEYIKQLYDNWRIKGEELAGKWNILIDFSLEAKKKLDTMIYIVSLYCVQDSRIPLKIWENCYLQYILQEQGNIFFVSIYDVLMKGQTFTTTMSQYKGAYDEGFMMDFGEKGGPTGPYKFEGGHVGKGDPGLKITEPNSIVTVIDFSSLYPTIIIAFNLDATTWVPPFRKEPYCLSEGIQKKNRKYLWYSYSSHCKTRLKDLYAQAKKSDIINLEDELKDRLEYFMRTYDDPPEIRMPYQKKSFSDDTENLLMDISELRCIINAPYEKKVRMMCHCLRINNEKLKAIHNQWFVRRSVLPGVLPGILWSQYKARKNIKKLMGEAFRSGDINMGNIRNAQQLGTKIGMNSSYGGLGAKSNRLACFPAAETITYIGRSGILKCNEEIEKRNYGKVVYNDTDSAMVLITDTDKKFGNDFGKMKKYTEKMAEELSSLYMSPIMFEAENWFISFLLKAPKMYSAIIMNGQSFDIEDYTREQCETHNLLYVKGMAPVRKDKCKFHKLIFKNILYGILTRQEPEYLLKVMESAMEYVWNINKILKAPYNSLQELKERREKIVELFSYNIGITVTSSVSTGGTVGRWRVIYQNRYKSTPSVGERFDVLVVNGPDKDKHTRTEKKMMMMDWMLDVNEEIDPIHYILAYEGKGQMIELLKIAYPGFFKDSPIKRWYLPILKYKGTVYADWD